MIFSLKSTRKLPNPKTNRLSDLSRFVYLSLKGDITNISKRRQNVLGNALRKRAKLRNAHEAVMTEDARKVLRMNRENLAGTRENDESMIVADNITIGDQKSGLTKAALVALSLASGTGAGIIGASLFGQQERTQPAQPAPPPIVAPLDPQEDEPQYELRLVD